MASRRRRESAGRGAVSRAERRVAGLALCAGGIGLLLGAVSGNVPAAPITFNTALPVAKGTGVFRAQFVGVRRSDDPTAADRELTVLGGVGVLGYGVTEDFAVFGVVPYLDKELELATEAGERIERTTSGLGDVRVFGRYTVLRRDAPGRTFRIAPFAGVEAPTGEDDERDTLGRLPQPLQLGSGSWDPFFGVVGTWQTLDYQVDAQVSYEVNTEANDFEFGDLFRADASLQYRLWPRELGPGVPAFVYGVLEADLSHRGQNRMAGASDPDSGGTTLFLTPGLQYVSKRLIIEAAVQVPVLQDLNGGALADDYTVRAGFRFNF